MTTAVTTVGPENSWRLIYDTEKKVISYFESTGYTTSIHTIFEGRTEMECMDEAQKLGLELPIIEALALEEFQGDAIAGVVAAELPSASL